MCTSHCKGATKDSTEPGQKMKKTASFFFDCDSDRREIIQEIHSCTIKRKETLSILHRECKSDILILRWNCTWPRFIILLHWHKVLVYRELICWQHFFREIFVLCRNNLHMATLCYHFKKEARKMRKRGRRETTHKFQSNKILNIQIFPSKTLKILHITSKMRSIISIPFETY